jgi:hypothetical protein
MATPKFDRCIRVNSQDVFIVKGKERVHVPSYDELREKWGDPPIEDVSESAVADIKLVKQFSKPRKPKAEEPVKEAEAVAEEPDVRAPEEV